MNSGPASSLLFDFFNSAEQRIEHGYKLSIQQQSLIGNESSNSFERASKLQTDLCRNSNSQVNCIIDKKSDFEIVSVD